MLCKLCNIFQNSLEYQSSTHYSPYFLMFHRHPLRPETVNTSSLGNAFDVTDPEDELDQRLKDVKAIQIKVRSCSWVL